MKKLILLAMVLCILFSAVACGTPAAEETVPTEAVTEPETVPAEPVTAPATEAATVPPEPEVFTLTFVGDCTLGSDPGMMDSSGFVSVVGSDYAYPFRNVREYFENDDFTMVNLEGVLGDQGYPANKTFRFRGPGEYANILAENSVEAVTLANNHSMDYGHSGYNETKRILDEAGLPYVEKDGSSLVKTESGLTIGLYAASFVIDQKDLEKEVAALREQGADIVVFAIHWGTEGSYRAHAHNVQQAYDAIDAGVDIVYGSHPHVLQKIEEYNGGIIYYSLGNFCFGGNHFPSDMDTAVIQQQVIREPDGTVRLGELTVIPCSVSSIPIQNNFQPTPYPQDYAGYDRVMSKLDGTWKGANLSINYGPITSETVPPTETPTTPTTPPSEVPSAPPSGGTESGGDSGSDSGTSGGETPAPDPVPSPDPTPAPDPAPAPDPDPAPDTGSEG